MSYGIEVYNSVGTKIWGVDAPGGGLLLGVFAVPATGGNVVVPYSGAVGRTVVCTAVGTSATYGGNPANNISLPMCTIDYSLGFPRVTAVPAGRAATVYVFAQ